MSHRTTDKQITNVQIMFSNGLDLLYITTTTVLVLVSKPGALKQLKPASEMHHGQDTDLPNRATLRAMI